MTSSVSTTTTGRIVTRSFFDLLRTALGYAPQGSFDLNAEEWSRLHAQAARQSLLGVTFYAIGRAVPNAGSALPRQVYLKWFYHAESVKALNAKHYELSRKLTALFEEQGVKAIVLKGQGNSRNYPDKFIRQTGDIDIWFAGGRKKVLAVLSQMGLLEKGVEMEHDVVFADSVFGAELEVHYKFVRDSRNPFANRRLKRILAQEIRNPVLVEEGFYVPTNRFSLLAQLSHIRKHLFTYGVGFRQVMDYAVLLRASSAAERAAVASVLKPTGLLPIAGALMWVLSECLGLESQYLLCKPDGRRGRVLLKALLKDGNFGKYASRKRGGALRWWIGNRLHLLRMLPFDFPEVSWFLLRYWASFVFGVPERVLAFCRYKRHK